MEKVEKEVSRENLEKLVAKAQEKYQIFLDNIVKSSKLEAKNAFLIGFSASSLLSDPSSDDSLKTLNLIWDFMNENNNTNPNPETASMKNLVRKTQLEKLQKEEEKNFFEEKKEKNQKFLLTLKPQKKPEINVERSMELCKICLDSMFSAPIHLMEGCTHVFHQECLREYLASEIDQKLKNAKGLKCPEEHCNKVFDQNELKSLLHNDKIEKFIENSLENYIDFEAKDVSWCPTPGCKFAFIKEKHPIPNFECPLCKKNYCLFCRTEYREKKHECPKTDEDSHFETFAKGQKFKQCNECRFWVEKTIGCDHMTCRCGHQFCYKCGGPYKACFCKENNDFCQIF